MTSSDTIAAPAATADAVADRVLGAALGWVETMSIHLGDQLGWYDSLVEHGPSTARELARATGTDGRYAQEWLEQQAAFGMIDVVRASDTARDRVFGLGPGWAEVLTDRKSQAYVAPLARMLAASGAQIDALVTAYRQGGGVSWAQFGDLARTAQADANRPWLAAVPEVFARHPHVHDRLAAPGARIADVGAGAGWSAIAVARAYPLATVVGIDVDPPSVAIAQANAEQAGVSDRVTFHVGDAADLARHGTFDAAFAFECVHDLPNPVAVLNAMRTATGPDGLVIVMDEAVADEFTPDADDLERMMFGFSLFVCLPDSRAHDDSAATGTVMRRPTLARYAREAGFARIGLLEDGFGFWRFYELDHS